MNRPVSAAESGSIAPLIIVFTLLYIFASWQAGILFRDAHVSDLRDEGAHQLNLYVQHLRGELAKFEFLPQVFASDERLIHMLKNPDDPERVQTLNEYLESVNRVIQAADTYLMDVDGFTIAASNWQSERPFVGRNFGYRPYFQQAMKGELGRYYALGTTSLKRGYYFAYPVQESGTILGAVVVKVDLRELEHQWEGKSREVVVTDPDGVIFITTKSDWRFRTFSALPDEAMKRIIGSKRYLNSRLQPLPLERQMYRDSKTRIWQFNEEEMVPKQHRQYLVQEQEMEEAGWQVLLLTPLTTLGESVWIVLGLAFLFYVVLVLLGLFLHSRRTRKLERLRYEEYTQEALRKAYDQLEVRVQERTVDLSREVDERRRAESELRQTQKELVQTGKLAVLGQMSAGINHELNQPLTAIRSYADNSNLLLNHQRYDDVRGNLRKIAEMVDRMAVIGAQLKQFARKTTGHCVTVSVADSVAASMGILSAKLKTVGVSVDNQITREPAIEVKADAIQLEQILVNLINNAANAIKNQKVKVIQLSAQRHEDTILVHVKDNGPGVPQERLEQVFEPFFTTRESGLGLGLSISQRIAHSMGGSLAVVNATTGGAVFTLSLRAAHPHNDITPTGSDA